MSKSSRNARSSAKKAADEESQRKLLAEIVKEDKSIRVMVSFELDLNENIKVITIRRTGEDERFVFSECDQDLELHKHFQAKASRRFASKNIKSRAEIDFYLDAKLQKEYIKNGYFVFNGKPLVKLDEPNSSNLYDPAYQDPQIFMKKFLDDHRKPNTSDDTLFNKFQAAVNPKLRSFVIDHKLKGVTFDAFKKEFISKYKDVHFKSVEKIVFSKLADYRAQNFEQFLKKKIDFMDKLIGNCSKEELMVKLVICAFPDDEKKKLYNNLDLNRESLLKRSKDLLFLEKVKDKEEYNFYSGTSVSEDSSEDDEEDENGDDNPKAGGSNKKGGNGDNNDPDQGGDKSNPPKKKRGRPTKEGAAKKKLAEEEQKRQEERSNVDMLMIESSESEDENEVFFEQSVRDEANEERSRKKTKTSDLAVVQQGKDLSCDSAIHSFGNSSNMPPQLNRRLLGKELGAHAGMRSLVDADLIDKSPPDAISKATSFVNFASPFNSTPKKTMFGFNIPFLGKP